MSGRRRSLGHDLAVFGIGAVVGQAASAATTPVFARVLGPSEFGFYETTMAGISFLTTLLLFGFDQAIVARLAATPDEDAQGRLIGTSLAFPLGAAVGMAAPLAALALGLDWPRSLADRPAIVILSALSVPFLIAAQISQEILRNLDLRRAYLWSVTSRSVLSSAIAAACIVALSPRVEYLLGGLGAGAALAAVSSTGSLRRRRRLRPSRAAHHELMALALPLVPTSVANWVTSLADRLILVGNRDLAEVGRYGVANRIAALVTMIGYGFGVAFTSRGLTRFHEDPKTEAAHRGGAALLLGAGLGATAAALSAFGRELTAVVGGEAYRVNPALIPLLAYGFALLALTTVSQVSAWATGRTRTMSVIAVAACVVNVIGAFALIPWLGALGAALASLLAWGVYAALHLRMDRAISPARLPWPRVACVWLVWAPATAVASLDVGIATTTAKVVVVTMCLAVTLRWLLRPREIRALLG